MPYQYNTDWVTSSTTEIIFQIWSPKFQDEVLAAGSGETSSWLADGCLLAVSSVPFSVVPTLDSSRLVMRIPAIWARASLSQGKIWFLVHNFLIGTELCSPKFHTLKF